MRRYTALLTVLALGIATPLVAQTSAPAPPTAFAELPDFRLFLHDGTSIVSFGEPTRAGDRIVFSMPTSASSDDPRLQLVSLSASEVDWDRTLRYVESVRAARYVANHAEENYQLLTVEIGQAINDVALTTDPAARLAIVERARKTVADWPARHFNYRLADINRMLIVLDDAIASLRAAAGVDQFALNFVASTEPARAREPLLPKPTLRQVIEQTIAAAHLSETSAERISLMRVALAGIERDADILPSDWRTEVRTALNAEIATEVQTDRQYQTLSQRVRTLSGQRARAADVRGLERLMADLEREDAALGGRRPDVVRALATAVRTDLDLARQLRLSRDRWVFRLPELRKHRDVLTGPVDRLEAVREALEDIKALAGSTPLALASIQQASAYVAEVVTQLVPPDEFRPVHDLLSAAAGMADRAARIRREAALTGDMTRAWDASAAASGALMLTARAIHEIGNVLNQPQLPQ